MLSKLFANIKLGISFWLIGLALLLWGAVFYIDKSLSPDLIFHNFILYYTIPTVFIMVSIFVNYFIFDKLYRVTKRNYYIPLLFTIIWAWQPDLFTWQNGLSLLLLNALYFSFQRVSQNSEESISHLLNIGIISFLVSLISPYGIFILVLNLLHSVFNSNKNWRQFVLPLYGFLLAFGVAYGLAFLFDLTQELLNIFYNVTPTGTNLISIQNNLYLLFPLTILFALSFFEYIRSLGKAPVIKQKALSLLIWHFILASLLLFLYNFQSSLFVFIFFPSAILFANHLQYISKFLWREIWIWLLILMNFIPFIIYLK